MRKLFLLLGVILCMTACSKNEDNNPTDSPITGLELPSAEAPVKRGETVFVKGKGFSKSSEIWFRTVVTKATESQEVKAEIVEVTNDGISFIAPNLYGNQNLLLKENGVEYSLGNITFEEKSPILPNKITKIECSSSKIGTQYFTYDEKGRIIKVEDDWQTDYLTYKEDRILYGKEEVKDTFLIKNNRAESWIQVTVANKEKTLDKFSFFYDSTNFLSSARYYKGYVLGTETEYETATFSYSDNLLKDYSYEEEDKIQTSTFEYSNVENNLNIDLFGIIGGHFFEELGGYLYLFNIAGNRSKYLPIKITSNLKDPEGEYPSELTISYEQNKDGYITKITISEDEEKGEKGETWTYKLFYE